MAARYTTEASRQRFVDFIKTLSSTTEFHCHGFMIFAAFGMQKLWQVVSIMPCLAEQLQTDWHHSAPDAQHRLLCRGFRTPMCLSIRRERPGTVENIRRSSENLLTQSESKAPCLLSTVKCGMPQLRSLLVALHCAWHTEVTPCYFSAVLFSKTLVSNIALGSHANNL